MKLLISKHKVFYCPLKADRKVDDSDAQQPYQAVSNLSWSPTELLERNHIAAASLVWVHLKELAYQCQTTVYQLKQGLLSDYLRAQLSRPTIKFA